MANNNGAPHGTQELLEVIYEQNKRINRKLNLLTIGGTIRFLVILIPIVLALIFIPPFLRSFSDSYGSFLKTLGGGGAGKPASGAPANKGASASQFDTLLKQFQNGQLQISPEMVQQVLKSLQQ